MRQSLIPPLTIDNPPWLGLRPWPGSPPALKISLRERSRRNSTRVLPEVNRILPEYRAKFAQIKYRGGGGTVRPLPSPYDTPMKAIMQPFVMIQYQCKLGLYNGIQNNLWRMPDAHCMGAIAVNIYCDSALWFSNGTSLKNVNAFLALSRRSVWHWTLNFLKISQLAFIEWCFNIYCRWWNRLYRMIPVTMTDLSLGDPMGRGGGGEEARAPHPPPPPHK